MKPSEYVRKGWCQRVAAVDKLGLPCYPTSRMAHAWCAIGAIEAAYPNDNKKFADTTEKLYLKLKGLDSIGEWNDAPTRTQAQVVALLESIGE